MYEGLWATRLAPFTGQPSEWTATLDNPPQCLWNKGPTADPRGRERRMKRGSEWDKGVVAHSLGPLLVRRQLAHIHNSHIVTKTMACGTGITPCILSLDSSQPLLLSPTLSPSCTFLLSQSRGSEIPIPFSPWHCFLLAVSVLLSFYSQTVRRNSTQEYS